MSDMELLSAFKWKGNAEDYCIESRTVRAVQRLVVKGSVELYFRHGDPSLTVAVRSRTELADVLTTVQGDALTVEARIVSFVAGGGVRPRAAVRQVI